jgi:hypothetical protein
LQLNVAIDTATGLATATFPADMLQAVLDALSAPAPAPKQVFSVKSDETSGLFYDVVYDPETNHWTCTCKDYFHRSPRVAPEQYICKHILRVQFSPVLRSLASH